MIVVVDASAAIDALLGVEGLIERLRLHELHAPVSIDAEFLHGTRRKLLGRLINTDDADTLIETFQVLPITRHPVQRLVRRMWAIRQNVTAYDASYVALAELLDAPLLTRDRRLSKSSGHSARIEYID